MPEVGWKKLPEIRANRIWVTTDRDEVTCIVFFNWSWTAMDFCLRHHEQEQEYII